MALQRRMGSRLRVILRALERPKDLRPAIARSTRIWFARRAVAHRGKASGDPSGASFASLRTALRMTRLQSSPPLRGYCYSRFATNLTGASCVSVKCPSISTVSPTATGICPDTESARISVSVPLLRPGVT